MKSTITCISIYNVCNSKRSCTLIRIIGLLLMVYCIYIWYNAGAYNGFDYEYWLTSPKILKNSSVPTYGFRFIRQRGVYSLWNICIEAVHQPIQNSLEASINHMYYNETKRIVMYSGNMQNRTHKLEIAGSPNARSNFWDLRVIQAAIPNSYRFLQNTAYFIEPTCPGNFHHFWYDEFIYIYTTMQQTNRLKRGSKNQILYRHPLNLANMSSDCYSTSTYENILKTLYIEPFHDVFYRLQANTCFATAVFGVVTKEPARPRDAVEHVLRELNISQVSPVNSIPSRSDLHITFINRSNRRILNMDELLNATISAGYKNSRVVNLEQLDVRNQALTAARSHVWIGVQGAGLQWAIFMPPGSTLIEIAWPDKYWTHYYPGFVKPYEIGCVDIDAVDVHPNWTTYEREIRGGSRPVSVKERELLVISPPAEKSSDNIWKHADVVVSTSTVLNKLALIGLR